MTDTLIPEESPVPQSPNPRRSGIGRLYHGETSIDFYGRRWIGLGVSAALVIISIVSLLVSGLNLSLEFKGGVLWEVPTETMSEADARAVLDSQGLDGSLAKVQILTSKETGRNLEVQVGAQPDEVRLKVQEAFAAAAKVPVDDVATQLVSSSWGASITEKAVKALIVFLILVSIFIAWRLEWRMALAAIAAMLHDVIVSVGVYSVFGFEVTPATVVAFLTILGFSLYDTIVVFDKLNENQDRYASYKMPYGDILNVSMNQVFMRSLNTSIAAVLPVLSLLVLGSGVMGAVTLREFSLALLIGLITGSYSSIFVASPLVALAKEREGRYKAQRGRHSTGAELERLVHGGAPLGRREGGRQRTTTDNVETLAPQVERTPQEVLTHTPRPRKKKRRA